MSALVPVAVVLAACSSSSTPDPGPPIGTGSPGALPGSGSCTCTQASDSVQRTVACGASICVNGVTIACSASGAISQGGPCIDTTTDAGSSGTAPNAAGACQTPCASPGDEACQAFGTTSVSCVPVTTGGNRCFVTGATNCPAAEQVPFAASSVASTILCVPGSCPTPGQ